MAMEAATASGAGLLNRDGANPIAPAAHGHAREAIDGVTRCNCCGRYPLVGEHVVRHSAEGRRAEGWACDSCEEAGRTGRLGPVALVTRVRSFGGAMNVRRLT
jgi:hypothetical protein